MPVIQSTRSRRYFGTVTRRGVERCALVVEDAGKASNSASDTLIGDAEGGGDVGGGVEEGAVQVSAAQLLSIEYHSDNL
jgi:hypothetical protein